MSKWFETAFFLVIVAYCVGGITRTDEGPVTKSVWGATAALFLLIAYRLHKPEIDWILREMFS